MFTQLAQVKVTRVEAGSGFLITCPLCPFRAVRGDREAADYIAVAHQRAACATQNRAA